MDQHEAAAAEIAGARHRHRQRKADRDRRIDRVAAALQNIERRSREAAASWLTTMPCAAMTGRAMAKLETTGTGCAIAGAARASNAHSADADRRAAVRLQRNAIVLVHPSANVGAPSRAGHATAGSLPSRKDSVSPSILKGATGTRARTSLQAAPLLFVTARSRDCEGGAIHPPQLGAYPSSGDRVFAGSPRRRAISKERNGMISLSINGKTA